MSTGMSCRRWPRGTHAPIKPSASAFGSGPVEIMGAVSLVPCVLLLLSFRNPPSSASRAVLAVFWTWDGNAVLGTGGLRRPTHQLNRGETCQTTQTLVVT